MAMIRGLRANDMFQLSLVAEPHPSADGRYVAYVRGCLDREADAVVEETVVTDLGTGAESRPGPGGLRTAHPRWAPDGRLGFLSDASGTSQLWVWAPGDRAARQLTWGTDPVTDLDWSPDGRKLAVTRGAAGGRRVQVVPADGRAGPEEVPWSGRADAWHPRWSPDAERLAFIAGSQLHVTSTQGAGAWCCPGEGPVLALTWGPSGEDIAYLAPRVRDEADIDVRLFRWTPGCPDPAELADGWDRSLGSTVRSDDGRGTGSGFPPSLAWSAATGRIYFTVADGGRGRLGWADPVGGGCGYLSGGDRTCLDPGLDHGGNVIAFVSTTPADPGDVYLIGLTRDGTDGDGTDGDGERRVTDANPWLRGLALAGTRPVTAGDHDGVPVEGWVTAFDGPNGRPLVVSVHGGPHYPAGWRFSFEAQRLAAHGYAVLTANPAGSGGYGRRFATAIRGGWGGADWASLERLIDAVAAAPGIDAGRVAITGVSYGGFLSMWAVTRSARFCAAISENGISNLLAEWGAEDDDGAWLTAELGGPPWERPEVYVASSPIAAADRIRTPLLLIHAEEDRNCPIGQSEQMLAALRSLGRDVELVVIQGEGHLMNLTGRPSRRLTRARAVDRWLGRYLGPEGAYD
jgi:dipeptidyl aminopeptidase/acylaminoacyl peptidase